jgi:hypothetical protein
MSSPIPESDRKAFKKLRQVALERMCERILVDVDRIASNGTKCLADGVGPIQGVDLLSKSLSKGRTFTA